MTDELNFLSEELLEKRYTIIDQSGILGDMQNLELAKEVALENSENGNYCEVEDLDREVVFTCENGEEI